MIKLDKSAAWWKWLAAGVTVIYIGCEGMGWIPSGISGLIVSALVAMGLYVAPSPVVRTTTGQ